MLGAAMLDCAPPLTQTVRVSRIGAGPARRLASAPRVVGRVHSVFRRAVNLLGADGRLLTLQGPGPLAAPFAVALGELPRWPELEPGMAMERSGTGLVLGAVRLDCSAARLVDTTIAAGLDPSVLAAALGESPLPRAAPSLGSAIALEGRRRLADGLRSGDGCGFAAGALPLIGLGEGLTPAGDDFLVGVLAVARRFRPGFLVDHPDVGRALAAARDRTTVIAGAFLIEALEDSFSEAVIALATASCLSAARTALADLLEMGATSGADTAAGMRLGLDALAR
jgi:hypothetical protein